MLVHQNYPFDELAYIEALETKNIKVFDWFWSNLKTNQTKALLLERIGSISAEFGFMEALTFVTDFYEYQAIDINVKHAKCTLMDHSCKRTKPDVYLWLSKRKYGITGEAIENAILYNVDYTLIDTLLNKYHDNSNFYDSFYYYTFLHNRSDIAKYSMAFSPSEWCTVHATKFNNLIFMQ